MHRASRGGEHYRLTTGGLYRWEYAQDGRVLDVEVAGPLIANDSEVLLAAARAGAGIAVAFEGTGARGLRQRPAGAAARAMVA